MRKMSCNEMEKVHGTRVSLPMDLKYRNKANCMNEAARLIDQHLVTGMTQQQIQEEIFGHAVAFYDGQALVNYIGTHGGVVGGMAATAANEEYESLIQTAPFIANIKVGSNIFHYIVVFECDKRNLIIGDPSSTHLIILSCEMFCRLSTGALLIINKKS